MSVYLCIQPFDFTNVGCKRDKVIDISIDKFIDVS